MKRIAVLISLLAPVAGFGSGGSTIVSVRTQIAALLCSFITTAGASRSVDDQLMVLSGTCGEFDSEYHCKDAKVMGQVYATLSTEQQSKLAVLRKSVISGTRADGAKFAFSTTSNRDLHSNPISDTSAMTTCTGNIDDRFFETWSGGDAQA